MKKNAKRKKQPSVKSSSNQSSTSNTASSKRKEAVLDAWGIMLNPAQGFKDALSQTLEERLGKYFRVLLMSAILTFLMTLGAAFVRAIYLDYFKGVGIDYANLLNYQIQISVGATFFVFFAGTILFFLFTVLAHRFAKISYVRTIIICSAAMSPVLLLGWINPTFALTLVVWTLVLVFSGVKIAREESYN